MTFFANRSVPRVASRYRSRSVISVLAIRGDLAGTVPNVHSVGRFVRVTTDSSGELDDM